MKRIFLAFTASLVLISCASKRKNTKTNSNETQNTTVEAPSSSGINIAAVKNTVQNQSYQYQTLAIKAEAGVTLPGIDQNIQVNMRMQNQQKIWISATALFGIEVGRVLITPEKIRIINKLQGQYIEKPFSFVKQYVGDLDFETLQDIFVGNVPNDFWNEKSKVELSDKGKKILESIISDFTLRYTLNEQNRPEVFDGKEGQQSNTCRVLYSNYNAENLPMQVLMDATSTDKKFGLRLHYTSVERNIPLEFPFNVPSKYKTIN